MAKVHWASGMIDGDPDKTISAALEFEPRPSLDEMIAQVRDDHWTVYCGQHARLIGGMTDRPMPQQIRRLAVYAALAEFLERIKSHPKKVGEGLIRRGVDVEA